MFSLGCKDYDVIDFVMSQRNMAETELLVGSHLTDTTHNGRIQPSKKHCYLDFHVLFLHPV